MYLFSISLLVSSSWFISVVNTEKPLPESIKTRKFNHDDPKCVCFPEGQSLIPELMHPNEYGLERLVVYVYRVLNTNKIIAFTPSNERQTLIPNVPFTNGDLIKHVTTETIASLFDNNKQTFPNLPDAINIGEALGLNTGTVEKVYLNPDIPDNLQPNLSFNPSQTKDDPHQSYASPENTQPQRDNIDFNILNQNKQINYFNPATTSLLTTDSSSNVEQTFNNHPVVINPYQPKEVTKEINSESEKIQHEHDFLPIQPKHLTFDLWLTEQMETFQYPNVPQAIKMISFHELKLLISQILFENHIRSDDSGIVTDSTGMAINLSHLELRPVLVGDPLKLNGFQGNQRVTSRQNLPFFEGILLVLIHPFKILGVIPRKSFLSKTPIIKHYLNAIPYVMKPDEDKYSKPPGIVRDPAISNVRRYDEVSSSSSLSLEPGFNTWNNPSNTFFHRNQATDFYLTNHNANEHPQLIVDPNNNNGNLYPSNPESHFAEPDHSGHLTATPVNVQSGLQVNPYSYQNNVAASPVNSDYFSPYVIASPIDSKLETNIYAQSSGLIYTSPINNGALLFENLNNSPRRLSNNIQIQSTKPNFNSSENTIPLIASLNNFNKEKQHDSSNQETRNVILVKIPLDDESKIVHSQEINKSPDNKTPDLAAIDSKPNSDIDTQNIPANHHNDILKPYDSNLHLKLTPDSDKHKSPHENANVKKLAKNKTSDRSKLVNKEPKEETTLQPELTASESRDVDYFGHIQDEIGRSESFTSDDLWDTTRRNNLPLINGVIKTLIELMLHRFLEPDKVDDVKGEEGNHSNPGKTREAVDDDRSDFRIIGGSAATGSGAPLSNKGRSGLGK